MSRNFPNRETKMIIFDKTRKLNELKEDGRILIDRRAGESQTELLIKVYISGITRSWTGLSDSMGSTGSVSRSRSPTDQDVNCPSTYVSRSMG